MGAKTPANVKEKRTMLTCEECQRDFQTLAAIKTHTMAKHPEKYKQMQNSDTETTEEKKTAFVPPTSRVSKRLQQKRSTDKDSISEDSSSSTPDQSRVVFECPRCLKAFPVYFSALKHIQKYHSVDTDGNPVSLDSPKLIKPVLKEICTTCDKLIQGAHSCKDILSSVVEPHEKGMYSCLGCQGNFRSVASFDDHVAGAHNENADILIFGNNNEFLAWKAKIESKVRVKYLTLSNTTQRQYYQCNYVSHKNSADITHLCPSMMITREFSKGIHIRYYKDHHGHTTPKLTKNNDEVFNILLKNDDDDLYDKFKKLLKSLALGASKINLANLRKLYNDALEMQKNLNTYKELENAANLSMNTQSNNLDEADNGSLYSDGDNDDKGELSDIDKDKESHHEETTNVDKHQKSDREEITNADKHQKSTNEETEIAVNKSMNDEEIAKVLEAPRTSARLKRKSESSTTFEPKKSKLDTDNEVNQTELDSKQNNSTPKNVKNYSPKVVKSSPITQSPSFNDTYKQFIDSALKPTGNETTELKSKLGKKYNKKENNTIKPTDVKVDNTVISKVEKNIDISLRSRVDKKNTLPTPKREKKEIVKTKMGQFISPKKATFMTESSGNVDSIDKKRKKGPNKQPRTSIANLNLDKIEYEVVEQENDCNILVLKI